MSGVKRCSQVGSRGRAGEGDGWGWEASNFQGSNFEMSHCSLVEIMDGFIQVNHMESHRSNWKV